MDIFFYLLLHGSRKTKLMLGGILLLFLASLTGLLIGIFTKNFVLGAAGFMLLIFSIVLLASISFESVERKEQKKREQKKEGKKKLTSAAAVEPKEMEGNSKRTETLEKTGEKEGASVEELSPEELERRNRQKEEEEKLAYFQSYDEKKLKKMLSKGGAKKGHETVMIDSWPKEHIRQCPAYLWREKDRLFFLVLEKESRRISVSIDKIKKVYYEKGVTADINEDYRAYTSASLVGMIFAPVLPTYYEKVEGGQTRHCKNLYVLEPGIKLTNTSAKGLFSILGLEFPMEDEVSRSRKFDPYFVEAYHYQILLRDNAMSMEVYKESLLMKLAEKMSHTSMEFQELVDSLKKMMEYHLMPKDLANKCLDDYRAIRYERERMKRK